MADRRGRSARNGGVIPLPASARPAQHKYISADLGFDHLV